MVQYYLLAVLPGLNSTEFVDPAENNSTGEVWMKMIPVMLNRTIQRTPAEECADTSDFNTERTIYTPADLSKFCKLVLVQGGELGVKL